VLGPRGGGLGVEGMCMQRVLNCDQAESTTRKVRYVKVGPMLC
jgi:hypothetical protein